MTTTAKQKLIKKLVSFHHIKLISLQVKHESSNFVLGYLIALDMGRLNRVIGRNRAVHSTKAKAIDYYAVMTRTRVT